MVTTTPNSRLRQIAILVSSVDSASARHLLLNLPSEIARKVRAMAAEMGPIPPEERKELLLELQKHQPQPAHRSSPVSSVEPGTAAADSAVSDKIWSRWSDEPELPSEATSEDLEAADSGPAWKRLSVEAMVRFVRHERPTVIAVILHQLAARQAAAVLQRLPRSTSREVLRRLGSLQEIDHEAMQAIDEHLSQRLSEYRHKFETEAENIRRINELLEAAPSELKQQWASWMRPSITTHDLMTNGTSAAPSASGRSGPNNLHTLNTNTPDEPTPYILPFQPRHPENSRVTSGGLGPPKPISTSGHPNSTVDSQRPEVELESILKLSPDSLAALLSQMDSQTVLLSLAGATPEFMRRFNAMLQPADAKVLNDRIQRIGPLQLRDVEEAQRRIVQAYQAMTEPAHGRRAA